MQEVNPIIIFLMFIGRCLVPLLIMLGISYILKRLGLIREPPPPPANKPQNDEKPAVEGGLAHGKL
jgi:hypothetical protein